MTVTIEAVYEDGVLRPLEPLCLAEGQRVSVSVKPAGMTPTEAEAHLREWAQLYAGLSEDEVREIEAIILDRCRRV